MAIKSLVVDIFSLASMMTHSDVTVDPLAPETQQLKPLTSLKNKTLEVHEEIARLEWEFGMYFDEEHGPIVPSANIRACLIRGARLSKGGKKIERAVSIPRAAKIIYEGPRTYDEMYAAVNKHGRKRFVDRRSVKVGQSKVMRTRCIFREWKLKGVEIIYNDQILDETQLLRYLEDAGTFEGLLDGRILGFGRFSVKKAKKQAATVS